MAAELRPPPVIDLHADTLSLLVESGRGAGTFLEGPGAGEEGLQLDLPGASAAGLNAVALAAFVEPAGRTEPSLSGSGKASARAPRPAGIRGILEMAGLLREIEESGEGRVGRARSAREILDGQRAGRLSIILTLESAGDACEGSLLALEGLRDLGIRMAGLVWYARNPFGSGIGEGSDPGGLSPAGLEAVRALGRMGVAVDISHLNREGVADVLRAARGPVIATHSNSRAVRDHPRNLDDDQIREIAARGGVVGLCLFPKFLRDPATGRATVEDAVRHLEHLAEVGGIGCLASGTDFDGIRETPEGISGARDLPRIAAALRERGWTEAEVDAYRGGNALRVIEELGE